MYEWSNKEQTITSNRKNCNIIKKRLMKTSRLTFKESPKLCVIYLVTKKRIEIQSYYVYSEYIDGIQYIDIQLLNLERLQDNQHIAIGRTWSGWQLGCTRLHDGISVYANAHIYQNDYFTKIQTISELKYLTLQKNIYITDWKRLYKFRDKIEFLQKINCSLANDIIYPPVYGGIDMRIVTKKWLKENKSKLKNQKIDFNAFELQHKLQKQGVKVVSGIEKLMSYTDLKDVPPELKLVRFQNWLIKNNKPFTYYKDYLKMLEELDIISRYERVLMPKNLELAHDELVEQINRRNAERRRLHEEWLAKDKAEKEKIISNGFKKRLTNDKKLEKQIENYLFKLPQTADELQKEGETLHHCVANYVEKHATGKTTIILVRDINEPNKPLYTLEINTKRKQKIQFYGKYNQTPSDHANQILESYLQAI
ncbi:PcfJ domain-containing protein [Granulicatella balaenopterae]|nr:PcfJ domain-containing protein [Granulicatella balaenopterae]